MVPFQLKFARKHPRRRRDFSPASHRAPAVVRQLSQAYYREPKSPWHIRLWIFSAIVLVGMCVGALFAPWLQVQNIIVTGVPAKTAELRIRELVAKALETPHFWFLPGKSILLVSKLRIKQALAQEFYVEQLQVSRAWPNVLRVTIPNQVVVAVWQTNDKFFLIDNRGVLVQEISLVDLQSLTLPIVVESTKEDHKLGDHVSTNIMMEFINQVVSDWRQELPARELARVMYDSTAWPTLELQLKAGWYVKVTAQTDSTIQVQAVKRLLLEKIRSDEGKLLYIDARFGSQVSYKLR